MNILITGALGYIGSHVAVKISEENHNLTLIDNLANSSIKNLKNIEKITRKKIDFFKLDIRNEPKVKKIIYEKNIEAIFHFAGLKSVKNSEVNPDDYFDVNVNGSKTLLNAFEKGNNGKKIFIFSSSATVYGNPKILPCKEQHKEKPINTYGKTKKAVEKLLKIKASKGDWKIASLRYFNPIGSHLSGLIGDNPKGKPENLLPAINQVAKGDKKELLIFGSDYPTSDGTAIRDYIHIDDLADGHISTLKYLSKKRKNVYEVFNLGTGRGYSVLEIKEKFEKVNKVSVPHKFFPKRKGDIPINYADSYKANSLLKWKTKKSLDQMLKSSWMYEKKNNAN